MNRFEKKKKRLPKSIGFFLSFAVFPGLFLLFYLGLNSVSDTTLKQQQESLKDAIQKTAVHCYAVEGAYPESLDYLKEHYGITYDEKHFLVDYEIIGSNLMPDVTVILLKGGRS